MTALAGTMGRHYALKEGLPPGERMCSSQACFIALGSCTPACTTRRTSLPASDLAPALPAPAPHPAAVAEAIFESVLPRNAGDLLPQTPAGLLVSVADK